MAIPDVRQELGDGLVAKTRQPDGKAAFFYCDVTRLEDALVIDGAYTAK